MSLDRVDIGTLTRLIGDVTGKKFVLADDVKGVVTFTAPSIRRSEAFDLYLSVLSSSGFTVDEADGFYRVVRRPGGAPTLGRIVSGSSDSGGGGLITRVYSLKHAAASDLVALLKTHGDGVGAMGALDSGNYLVVTDSSEAIERIDRLVAALDRPGPERVTEVMRLEHADAVEIARQLNEALKEAQNRAERLLRRLPASSGAGKRSESASGEAPVIVASPHMNGLILVGTAPRVEELRGLASRMDVKAPSGRGRLNAIFLKYLPADEVAGEINNLLERSLAQSGTDAASRRRVAVEPNVFNNALLVDALPGDFEGVRKLVAELDLLPRQVHISVMIVEVNDTAGLTLGAELTALNAPERVGDTVLSGGTRFSDQAVGLMDSLQRGLFPQGITLGVGEGVRLDEDGNMVMGFPGLAQIYALRESGKVKILSETSLEAQNNREASVRVVNEIPVLKSTIEGGSGTARDVIQNIERMDVGVKLKMIPQILPDARVRVELNPSIEAVISEGGSNNFTPTIARREVSTTVTVPDGDTIVIAGLTRTDTQQTRKRIPLLGSIPLLGWLFRYDTDQESRTDLLIFVTPRIVGTPETSSAVADDWRRKTGITLEGGVEERENKPAK